MTQHIDDVINNETVVVEADTPLTLGLLRETLAEFPDDYTVVFPIMQGEVITDYWAQPAAVLSDPNARLVGIAIR